MRVSPASCSSGLTRLLSLVVLLLLSHGAVAQDEPASVPMELVRAILARRGDMPLILPGVFSARIAATIELPSEWDVLGSVEYASSTSAYVRATGTTDATREALHAQLVGAGWTPRESMRRGGFVPDESSLPAFFCGPESRLLTLWLSEEWDGTLIRVALRDAMEAGPCTGRQEPEPSFSEVDDHMPTLRIPEGTVRSSSMGGGVGRDGAYSGVRLETALPAGEIADRVSAELRAAGWEPDAAATGTVSITRSWTREFADGFRAYGQLLVLTVGEGEYEVTFQMTRMPGD